MGKQKTAEEACVEYSIAVAQVRELTRKIVPGECTAMASAEFQSGWPGNTTPVDPCISLLFSLKAEQATDREAYLEAASDIEEAMCDRCKESLKAVRERKEARKRLGAAKRSVDIVGKRLNVV